MADHATLFATELDLRSRTNLARAREICDEVPEDAGNDVAFCAGFELGVDGNADSTTLRIFATRSGDTGAVIRFVQHCAREFGLSGPWGFEWAHVSKTPIQNGFGGGALVLDLSSGNTLVWNDTHAWMIRQLARAGRTS